MDCVIKGSDHKSLTPKIKNYIAYHFQDGIQESTQVRLILGLVVFLELLFYVMLSAYRDSYVKTVLIREEFPTALCKYPTQQTCASVFINLVTLTNNT